MPFGTYIGWIQQQRSWRCPSWSSRDGALYAVRAVIAAEFARVGPTLRFGSRYRVHHDCRSLYLSFDSHILSGQLIKLVVVAFQCVDLVTADQGKVSPLLDAFAGTLCRSLSLHHVVRTTHRIAHRTGEGLG